MSAYVVFDVEIRDHDRYQDFMTAVKPALAAAGARYLARGGDHKIASGGGRLKSNIFRPALLLAGRVDYGRKANAWSVDSDIRSDRFV